MLQSWADVKFPLSQTVLHNTKKTGWRQAHWLTAVIPATKEVEIGRIAVQGHPGQKVGKTLFQQASREWGTHLGPQVLQRP
jgi:hypothetical protein